MGQSHTSTFREQFSHLELLSSSSNKFWHMHEGKTTMTIPGMIIHDAVSRDVEAEVRGEGPKNDDAAVAAAASLQPPIFEGAVVTVWQVNVTHNAYTAALCAPKAKVQAAGLGPRWHPTRYPAQQLRRLAYMKHPNVVPIHTTDSPAGDSSLLFAISPGRFVPVLKVMHQMLPTELLYGLCCVAEGLLYLHDKGKVSHNNLHWDAIYVSLSLSRQQWVIGDPQFMCPTAASPPVGAGSGQEEISDIKQLLDDVRTLRDAKHLPFVAPEGSNPALWTFPDDKVGVSDIFSFGVLVEQLISEGKLSALGKGNPGSLRSIGDGLRAFAKACQNADPSKRPLLSSFFELECVKKCTFVRIMRFLDSYPERTVLERTQFYWNLHLDLLKLPYEQLNNRIVPRLFALALWDDPCSESFLQHLLTPIRKVPVESLVAPAVDMAFPDVQDSAAASPDPGNPESASPQVKRKDGRIGVPVVGVLMHQEYASLLGQFLKIALKKPDMVQLTCCLLRNVDRYVANVDFPIVTDFIIPALISNLSHPNNDVVLEALRGFTSVAKSVFAAAERGADVGAAKTTLIKAYEKEIFYLAAGDTSLQARMTALKLVARTLKGHSALLPRPRALIALSSCLIAPIVCRRTPPSEKGLQLVTSMSISQRTTELITAHEFLPLLTPAEIVMSIMPALFAVSQMDPLTADAPTVVAAAKLARSEENQEEVRKKIVSADHLMRVRALNATSFLTEYVSELQRPQPGDSFSSDPRTPKTAPRDQPKQVETRDDAAASVTANADLQDEILWSDAMDQFFLEQEESARREGWVSFPDQAFPSWNADTSLSIVQSRNASHPDNIKPGKYGFAYPSVAFDRPENVPKFDLSDRQFDSDWNSTQILSVSKVFMANNISVPSVGGPSTRPHPSAIRLPGGSDVAVDPQRTPGKAVGTLSTAASPAESVSVSDINPSVAPSEKPAPKKKRKARQTIKADDLDVGATTSSAQGAEEVTGNAGGETSTPAPVPADAHVDPESSTPPTAPAVPQPKKSRLEIARRRPAASLDVPLPAPAASSKPSGAASPANPTVDDIEL